MVKWCDKCPREANSCDECKKSRFGFKSTEPKLTKEEKRKLRDKAKQINK